MVTLADQKQDKPLSKQNVMDLFPQYILISVVKYMAHSDEKPMLGLSG